MPKLQKWFQTLILLWKTCIGHSCSIFCTEKPLGKSHFLVGILQHFTPKFKFTLFTITPLKIDLQSSSWSQKKEKIMLYLRNLLPKVALFIQNPQKTQKNANFKNSYFPPFLSYKLHFGVRRIGKRSTFYLVKNIWPIYDNFSATASNAPKKWG